MLPKNITTFLAHNQLIKNQDNAGTTGRQNNDLGGNSIHSDLNLDPPSNPFNFPASLDAPFADPPAKDDPSVSLQLKNNQTGNLLQSQTSNSKTQDGPFAAPPLQGSSLQSPKQLDKSTAPDNPATTNTNAATPTLQDDPFSDPPVQDNQATTTQNAAPPTLQENPVNDPPLQNNLPTPNPTQDNPFAGLPTGDGPANIPVQDNPFADPVTTNQSAASNLPPATVPPATDSPAKNANDLSGTSTDMPAVPGQDASQVGTQAPQEALPIEVSGDIKNVESTSSVAAKPPATNSPADSNWFDPLYLLGLIPFLLGFVAWRWLAGRGHKKQRTDKVDHARGQFKKSNRLKVQQDADAQPFSSSEFDSDLETTTTIANEATKTLPSTTTLRSDLLPSVDEGDDEFDFMADDREVESEIASSVSQNADSKVDDDEFTFEDDDFIVKPKLDSTEETIGVDRKFKEVANEVDLEIGEELFDNSDQDLDSPIPVAAKKSDSDLSLSDEFDSDNDVAAFDEEVDDLVGQQPEPVASVAGPSRTVNYDLDELDFGDDADEDLMFRDSKEDEFDQAVEADAVAESDNADEFEDNEFENEDHESTMGYEDTAVAETGATPPSGPNVAIEKLVASNVAAKPGFASKISGWFKKKPETDTATATAPTTLAASIAQPATNRDETNLDETIDNDSFAVDCDSDELAVTQAHLPPAVDEVADMEDTISSSENPTDMFLVDKLDESDELDFEDSNDDFEVQSNVNIPKLPADSEWKTSGKLEEMTSDEEETLNSDSVFDFGSRSDFTTELVQHDGVPQTPLGNIGKSADELVVLGSDAKLLDQVDALTSEKVQLESTLAATRGELESVRVTTQNAAQKMEQSQAELQSRLDSQDDKVAQMQAQLESARVIAQNATQELERSLVELQSRLVAQNDENKQLQTQLESANVASESLLDVTKQLADLKSQLFVKEQENQSVAEQFADVQAALAAKTSEAESLLAAQTAISTRESDDKAKAEPMTEQLSPAIKRKFTKLYRAYERERRLRKESGQHLVEAEEQRNVIASTLRQLKQELASVSQTDSTDSQLDKDRVAALENQNEELNNRVRELAAESAAEIKSLAEKLNAAHENSISVEKQNAELNQLVLTQTTSLKEFAAANSHADDVEAELKSSRQELEQHRTDSKSQLHLLEQELKSVNQKFKTLENQLAEANEFQAILSDENAQLKEAEAELDRQQNLVEQGMRQSQQAEQQAQLLRTTIETLTNRNTELEAEIKQLIENVTQHDNRLLIVESERQAAVNQLQTVLESQKKTPKKVDELTQIAGIGPAISKKLRQNGITSLEQIAAWSAEDAAKFEEQLACKDRISRDQWIQQAQTILGQKSQDIV